MHHARKAILAMSLMSLAPCSHAGSVSIEHIGLDEGNTTALLESTSQYYVDAMRSLIVERYKDDYRAIRWEMLETSMKESNVARLEYRFVVDGQPQVRVYHALGGRPLSAMAKTAFDGPTPAATPTSPDDSLDEDWPGTSSATGEVPDYAAMDGEDSALYSGFNDTNIRARVLPPEPSAMEPFYIDGVDRALDPEFKALRAIEHDLRSKIIPTGGTVRGLVGGATCGSCRYAIETMARSYDIDIHLTQMFDSLPRAEREALIASGKARLRGLQLVDHSSGRPILARDVLSDARRQQLKHALDPSSLNRSFKGMPWRPRSFRLGPMRRDHGIESGEDQALPNPDAEELPPPQC